jgi:Carboxypeptidase regulatory-like domain
MISGLGRNFVAAVIFLVLFGVPTLRAQNTADVVGTVSDSKGAVVEGATVTLTNVGTGVEKSVKTTSDGNYSFTAVQVGSYTVTALSDGFKKFSSDITVAAGDRARVDATLVIGDVNQEVHVEATAPALQTDSSTVSSLITQQAAEDLPLNGRNIIKLVQLLPGVNEGSPGAITSGNRPDDRRLVSAFSVNGQGDTLNLQLIDGFDNNERIDNLIGVRPSIDAIQEVNISTNLYPADLSRTAGGVVDVITKSGSNDLHGSAYEFFRNKVLNASPNYFTPGLPNPPFRQNQYGASLGGPIRKNRTFFFVDFEKFLQAVGLSVTETVPTLFEEQNPGNFSDIGGPTLSPGQITPLGLDFFKMFPAPNQTPSNAGTPGFSTSQATAPVDNFGYTPTRTQGSVSADARIDQHFSNTDSLFARYSINDITTNTPSGFPNVTINGVTFNPGVTACFNCPNAFPGRGLERQQQLGLAYTHVVNSNLLVSFRFGYLRTVQVSTGLNTTPVANELGFPCTATSCVNISGLSQTMGLPSVYFENSPYQSVGDALFVPLRDFDNSFEERGMVSWNKGAHNIKFGIGLIRRQALISQSGNGGLQDGARGRFDFGGQYTGYALADLLEGLSTTNLRAVELSAPNRRSWEPSAYVQDDWRAKHWLTLNLGVRYDIWTPYTEVYGRISNFDQATGLLISPSLPGLQQSGPTAGVRTNYGDVAPRIGFAISLPHSFVIRGGYGLSYFPNNYQGDFTMANAPFQYNSQCGIEAATSFGPCTTYLGGQFANSAVATFYLPPTEPQAQTGGGLLAAGVPYPTLNISTATNTANYANQNIEAQPFHYPWGFVEQTNLMVQKEIAGNVFTVGYVGDFVHHNVVGEQGMGEVISQPANYLAPNPLVAEGFPWLANTFVTELGPYGYANYNALEVTFVRRFRNGLAVNAGYTWSHDLALWDETQELGGCMPSVVKGVSYPCFFDNVKNPSQPFQFTNLRQFDYGNADYDIPNRVTSTLDYDVPFGKSLTGVEGQLAKGWSFNLAGFWQSGLPFTVANATPQNGVPGATDLPDMICNGKAAHPTLNLWINPSCFQTQTAGTFGLQYPNQLWGPHQRDIDFSIFKVFQINERMHVQFRTEVFNLFNTPNFGTPEDAGNNNLGNAGFGTISTLNTTSNPRQIQFALKFLF